MPGQHYESHHKDWFQTLPDFNAYVVRKGQALADYKASGSAGGTKNPVTPSWMVSVVRRCPRHNHIGNALVRSVSVFFEFQHTRHDHSGRYRCHYAPQHRRVDNV